MDYGLRYVWGRDWRVVMIALEYSFSVMGS